MTFSPENASKPMSRRPIVVGEQSDEEGRGLVDSSRFHVRLSRQGRFLFSEILRLEPASPVVPNPVGPTTHLMKKPYLC